MAGGGRESSVGTATPSGLDGPGIEPRWGGSDTFRVSPDRQRGPPSLQYKDYRIFPWGKAAAALC